MFLKVCTQFSSHTLFKFPHIYSITYNIILYIYISRSIDVLGDSYFSLVPCSIPFESYHLGDNSYDGQTDFSQLGDDCSCIFRPYECILFLGGVLVVFGGCPRGVMVKAMNCGIIVREFVLQSRYYVHFRANTLGKGMNPLILPPAMGK